MWDCSFHLLNRLSVGSWCCHLEDAFAYSWSLAFPHLWNGLTPTEICRSITRCNFFCINFLCMWCHARQMSLTMTLFSGKQWKQWGQQFRNANASKVYEGSRDSLEREHLPCKCEDMSLIPSTAPTFFEVWSWWHCCWICWCQHKSVISLAPQPKC